jgi:hypothetical protein
MSSATSSRINKIINGFVTVLFGAPLILCVFLVYKIRADDSAEGLGRLCGGILFAALIAAIAARSFRKAPWRTYRGAVFTFVAFAVFMTTHLEFLSPTSQLSLERRTWVEEFPLKAKELAVDQQRRMTEVDSKIEPADMPDADFSAMDRAKLDAFAAALQIAERNALAAPAQTETIIGDYISALTDVERKHFQSPDNEAYSRLMLKGMNEAFSGYTAGVRPRLADNYAAQAKLYHAVYLQTAFLSVNFDHYSVDSDHTLVFTDQETLDSYRRLKAAVSDARKDYEDKHDKVVQFQQAARQKGQEAQQRLNEAK